MPTTDEAMIESRLVAPCCWNQTLDIHDSEVARTLRSEIHDRLAHGDTAVTIEDDLVARYGPALRAVPRNNPLPFLALGVFVVLALVATLLVRMLVRWSRASRAVVPAPVPATRDAWDDRLDEELRADDRDSP